MALEAASFIDDLVITNPVGATDQKSQGDDHIRLIKTAMKASLPGMKAARKFEDTTAGAGAVNFWTFYRNIAGVNGNIIGDLNFSGKDSAGNETIFARIRAREDTVTDGAEVGSLLLETIVGGVVTSSIVLPLVENEPFNIPVPVNGTERLITKSAFPFVLLETISICSSGTITATFQKNGVNIGGSANAVSSGEQTQAHTDAFAAGDDLSVVFSANAACLKCSLNLKIRRTG